MTQLPFAKVFPALKRGIAEVAKAHPDKIVGNRAGDLQVVYDEVDRLREENARLQRRLQQPADPPGEFTPPPVAVDPPAAFRPPAPIEPPDEAPIAEPSDD